MSSSFLNQWGEAAYTSAGFFWMAFWAFALGYIVSSMIQVFVTTQRMTRVLGGRGVKQVALATFFGFISSSCSFAALATTKSMFKKGAGFIPSIAFLLSSTNLVIELGIVISIFLSWQFVVAEYLGGIFLIVFMWIFVWITRPDKLIKKVRDKFESDKKDTSGESEKLSEKILKKTKWYQVGSRYIMEWDMVWKDVTIGFTVAGIISAFVPSSFFDHLFIGNADEGYSFLQLLQHTVAGPLAAFFTFIGSMGNIPLAGVLYQNGVSFAGIMAFIFSDLVVLPVLRINASYYGWKMSLYILLTLLVSLIISTLCLYYLFDIFSILPEQSSVSDKSQEFFKINYTFYFNIVFALATGFLVYLSGKNTKHMHSEMADRGKTDVILKYIAWACYLWLIAGLTIKFFF